MAFFLGKYIFGVEEFWAAWLGLLVEFNLGSTFSRTFHLEMSLLQRSLSTPGNGGYSTKYEKKSWKIKPIFETPNILHAVQLEVYQNRKWLFAKIKLLVIRSILGKKKFCICLNPGFAMPFGSCGWIITWLNVGVGVGSTSVNPLTICLRQWKTQ